jgi:LmbE family N-acetylglucosaminyl deacetylase
MEKIIIVSAHPDDETLGAGGTLLRHRAQNHEIFWLIITNISTEHGFSEERVKSIKQPRPAYISAENIRNFSGSTT